MTDVPAGFDSHYYLMVHEDVAEAGMDPIEHYLRFGRDERRTGIPPEAVHPMEAELNERYGFFCKAWAALGTNGISGDYAEFGVGTGKTVWCSWRASRTMGLRPRLWAFDSFKGLPRPEHRLDMDHPAWSAGRFAVGLSRFEEQCRAMGISDEELVTRPGYYAETLAPDRFNSLPTDIALAYVDCDMYSSTVDVLRYLGTVLKHGMIVAFDDWFCWSPSGLSGEQVALGEFLEAHDTVVFHPYVQFGWHGQSFFVERTPR